ncbi:DegT/DnrJ/EryC1/StrS family aminotransferase [Nocardia lijiangensis]|uniref:DegT/DnrJ/EryC1/StrS family aminotransferase n=1 Tax=Nocardia lijiangensis TaxID=299618 RepID=UPI000AC356CF|nr:DegT/DnrJ/EryC1/StrS family aminotransferase [Nocardia lijiangensis]
MFADVDPETLMVTPIARTVSDRILSLPLYPAMTDTDLDDVAAAARKIATAYQR